MPAGTEPLSGTLACGRTGARWATWSCRPGRMAAPTSSCACTAKRSSARPARYQLHASIPCMQAHGGLALHQHA